MCMSYLRLYPEVRDITGLLLAKLPRDAGSVIEFINIFLLNERQYEGQKIMTGTDEPNLGSV